MQNVMWRMGESPGSIRHTGRPHGADTDTVLAELGLSDDEVRTLHETGIV